MARYEIDTSPAAIDFAQSGTGVKRTVQNCKNLLMLKRGELPYDRNRGLDPALYDLPMTALREALLPELDRVMMWEPDAEVVSGSAALNEDGEVVISCVVEISLEEE